MACHHHRHGSCMAAAAAISKSLSQRGIQGKGVFLSRRAFSDQKKPPAPSSVASAPTSMVGTGRGSARPEDSAIYQVSRNRGPVSWPTLGLVAVAAASAVGYYQIERERRLERAMGKIVTSESDGWSPNPEFLAKRQWKRTKWGWFPAEDAFGGGEFVSLQRGRGRETNNNRQMGS
mmetsp:Transcript_12829/g.29860  ORF Transcript_12829/g.29860 Transcript_12829/m.29860 type:complete len:176 (+) Transcript_12829:3-530(+)